MSRMDLAGSGTGGEGGGWATGRALLKPDDQLQLTETDLNEEIGKVLTLQNPRLPDNLVQWSFKLRTFIKIPDPPNVITVLQYQGRLLHKESEEGMRQLAGAPPEESLLGEEEEEGENKDQEHEDKKFGKKDEDENDELATTSEITDATTQVEEGIGGEEEGQLEDVDEEEEEDDGKPKHKKVPNQFDFCERAALTYSNTTREISTQTIPPPTATTGGTVFQWTIYDEYQEDWSVQQREKEKESKRPAVTIIKELKKKDNTDAAIMARMFQSIKTLERMVNQNIFDDVAQDYRYWDDPSDEFKDNEGSLLPLWKFSYEKTKKHDVTDLCFNTKYFDLFGVAFGSMSYDDPMPNGAVGLFSVKNPSFPEWITMTDSPVMSLSFNKDNPHLLATGSMDGSVAVYNVMLPSNIAQYKSHNVKQKHTGVVWQICWAPETEEGNLAFYSVSIDGKIKQWVLSQNELNVTTMMTLFLDRPPIPGPDGTVIYLKGCGTSIVFYPEDSHIYLVGTEEGSIYKCNTDYNTIYMRSYIEAHDMPVYKIVFNKFSSSIFASCSGDWRIKIWEDERPEPLFMFDIGMPIGDVQWAPYSSTVIGCVSNDGKVTVFDLNINKYRPICSQQVVNRKRNKLTRLAFNETLPFIIVGDDKGTINTLKLSPNLRMKTKPSKKQTSQNLTSLELEIAKLEKILSFVREPDILVTPADLNKSSGN